MTFMITDEMKLAVAQALQNEWGIDPWGRLSWQAEKALKEDSKKALMFLAEAAVDAAILPYLEAYEKAKEKAQYDRDREPYPEV